MTRQEWFDQHPDAHNMTDELRAMLMAVDVKYQKTDPEVRMERDFQILYDKLRTARKTQEFYDMLRKAREHHEAKQAKKAKVSGESSGGASLQECIAMCDEWLTAQESKAVGKM